MEIKYMQELVDAIKRANENHYHVFGVRKVDSKYETVNAGERMADSYDWDCENDTSCRNTTGEMLGGASAINVLVDDLWMDGSDDDEIAEEIANAVQKVSLYFGDTVYLVAGESYDYGNDNDEIIIEDAIALAKVEMA